MSNRIGQQLGHYRLLRLLGHGGFASVYLGEHIHLGTFAAIKVLDKRLSLDEIAHFREEARTIARLEHPHIVRVLDFGVGEQDDLAPFLVMTYAPHGTLRQHYPKGARLSPDEMLSYVKQVAAALQYAHDQRLIHRDIKPENMLLGRQEEVWLSDFGLAIAAQDTSHERAGPRNTSGTIAYMAPEQARGRPLPASDQYALGIVVYEWLCGVRPFDGSYEEVAVQHALSEPPSLRERCQAVSSALEAVVFKALSKDPHQRYMRVQDFADALEHACRQGQRSATIPLDDSALQVAPGAAQDAGATSRNETICAVAWSPDRQRIVLGGYDRSVEVVRVTAAQRLFTYYGHAGGITALSWSPNGKYVASASLDKTIQIWDASTGEKIAAYSGHMGMIFAVSWSPDSKYLASTSGGTQCSIHIWEAASGLHIFTYSGHGYWVRALSWSPDGKSIVSGSWREVQVWESTTGRKLCVYKGHNGWARAVSWSSDGLRVASGGEDKTAQVWELSRGRMLTTHQGHADWVEGLAWSPDGKYIVSTGRDLSIQVWDGASGATLWSQRNQGAAAQAVVWLPDSRHIVAAGSDGSIHVWQAIAGKK